MRCESDHDIYSCKFQLRIDTRACTSLAMASLEGMRHETKLPRSEDVCALIIILVVLLKNRDHVVEMCFGKLV